MRTALSSLLAFLVLACPFLCGATEAEHAARGEHGATGSPGTPGPSHCPEESDNCVCRGAVESAAVKVASGDTIGVPLPSQDLLGHLAHSPAHWLAHLTHNGSPMGLARWSDSTAVRAHLQNFRC